MSIVSSAKARLSRYQKALKRERRGLAWARREGRHPRQWRVDRIENLERLIRSVKRVIARYSKRPQRMTREGREFLMREEGVRAYAYTDSEGWATFGVGHLIQPAHKGLTAKDRADWGTPANPKSDEFVMRTFKRDLKVYEKAVRKAVGRRLVPHRFDACVSLCFNIGTGGFTGSTVAREIRSRKRQQAANAFLLWNKPSVLRARREHERDLFLTGDYHPTASGDAREVQRLLRMIGWPLVVDGEAGPKTKEAIRDFQAGYARRNLAVDGVAGAKTLASLRWSAEHGGRCSAHFAFREFRSKESSCNGNGWIKVDRELVRGLERYRQAIGGPVVIVSGYRDPAKNACEGGASQSQHLHANAADIPPRLTVADVKALGCFSGIGYEGATGLVRHVDVRHRNPNPTGGTIRNPTVWRY